MPNDSSLDFSVGQATHTGLVRSKNEDSFGWFSLDGGELFIVADGMGGYAGGAEASKQTVLSFKGYFEAHYGPHHAPHHGSPEKTLQEALLYADARVQEIGRKNPALSSCGSTIVAFFVSGKTGYFIHAGDSRLYVFRNGHLRQVSRDHSAVQDMLSAGVISNREAAKAPKNVITQSVGGNIDKSRCTVERFEIVPGSSYLLCSDGLWGTVPADRLRKILSQPVPASSKANLMINAAIDAGGPDNITVQLIEFADDGLPDMGLPGAGFAGEKQQAENHKGLGRLFIVTVSVLVLISVVICGYFGYKYLADPSPETQAPCADSRETPKSDPADATPEARPDARKDAVQPDEKPDEKPVEKPVGKPEPAVDPVPEIPAVAVPAVTPEPKKQDKPKAQTESRSRDKPEAKSKARTEARPKAQPEAKSKARTESRPQTAQKAQQQKPAAQKNKSAQDRATQEKAKKQQ